MRTNAAKKLSFETLLGQPAANDTRPSQPSEQENLEMVRRIAGAMVRHLPSHVDKDELVSLGYMGLVEAQTRFDPSRGVPFAAFAAMRVRGAMIDYLRQIDPVSRDERTRLRNSDEMASVTLVDFACAEGQAAAGTDADEALWQSQQRALMWQALSDLSEREQLVVQRYFFEEQPLKKIGEELNVSESRICQIVGAAVSRLRAMVGADCQEEAA